MLIQEKGRMNTIPDLLVNPSMVLQKKPLVIHIWPKMSDIGRFTTDELDIAFENQAFSMAIGDIFPIQTAQGFSIIKLTDRVTRPRN